MYEWMGTSFTIVFWEEVEQVIATTDLTHSEYIYETEFLWQKLFLPQQTIILYSISFNVPFFFFSPLSSNPR